MTANGQSLPLPRRYFASGAYYRRNSACRLFGKQLAPIGQAGSLPPLEAEQLEEVLQIELRKVQARVGPRNCHWTLSYSSSSKVVDNGSTISRRPSSHWPASSEELSGVCQRHGTLPAVCGSRFGEYGSGSPNERGTSGLAIEELQARARSVAAIRAVSTSRHTNFEARVEFTALSMR